MFGARLGGLFRFLIGILLLQGATALLTYTALKTDLEQTAWLFAALAASLGILVALWFDSVLGSMREQTLARQQKRHSKERERYSRERERLRVQAERERAKVAVKKTKSGANLRTGLAVGGVAGLGVAMMLAQSVFLGLLAATTAGGAALGYTVRLRQEKRQRAHETLVANRLLFDGESEVPALELQPAPATPKRRWRKPSAESAED
ncbi:MAG: hypothetical protein EA400_08995 [Chromatiaceae bacterium]|nr:MAG: hypothetical protein EA400_08995 [Chromatiaceae bacterium]